MKNTSKLFAVILALAVAVSGIVITTLTASAADREPDTTVYHEYNGSACRFDNGEGEERVRGTSFDLDYYERDLYAPKTNLVAGKVYKAIYIFTIVNINAFDVDTWAWEVKAMPTEEYYFNITNSDIWIQGQVTKTAVVVPFKVTDPEDVKLKLWTHGALIDGSTLDKVMVVGADYNAYDAGDFDIVVEGVANAGSRAMENRPDADEWTPSYVAGLTATYYQKKGAYIEDNGNIYKGVFNAVGAPGFDENNTTPGGNAANNKYFEETIDGLLAISKQLGDVKTGLTDFTSSSAFFYREGNDYLVHYEGNITAANSGTYQFVGLEVDNGCAIKVNGQIVYEYWNNGAWFDGGGKRYADDPSFTLQANVPADIEIWYLELGGGEALTMQINDGSDKSFADAGISFDLTATIYKAWNDEASDWGGINNLIPGGNGGERGQYHSFDDNQYYDDSIEAIYDVVTELGTITVDTFIINRNEDFRGNAAKAGCFGDDGIVVRYTGYITATEDGEYSFGLNKADNGCVVTIDGTRVLEYWGNNTYRDNGDAENNALYSGETVTMKAGESLPIEVVYLELAGGEALTLSVDNGYEEVNFNDAGMILSVTPLRIGSSSSEIPVLGDPEGEVLAYVNFNGDDSDELAVLSQKNVYVDEDNQYATLREDGAIEFDAAAIIPKMGDQLIIEFVIQPEDVSRDHRIIMSMGNYPDAANVMGFYQNGLKHTNQEEVHTAPIVAGEWIKVKYVIEEGWTEIYINDVLAAEGWDSRYPDITGPIKFGEYTVEQWADPGFIGSVSEIRISTVNAKDPTVPEYPEEDGIVDEIDTVTDLNVTYWDTYGNYVFEGVAPGTYKIAYYFTLGDSFAETVSWLSGDDARMRISPKLYGLEYARVWIDFQYDDIQTFVDENGVTKGILIAVLTLPKGYYYDKIDAGFWTESVDMTIDKVVLATADYDFINETEYTWVLETAFDGNVENIWGNGAALIVNEEDWTASTRETAPPVTGGEEEPPVTGGEEEPPVTGGEEEPPVTGGDEDPVGPGPGKTGDVATPIAVMALLAVAAAGIVVLKKKEVKQ